MPTINVVQPRPANRLPAFNDTSKATGQRWPLIDVSNRPAATPMDRQTRLDACLHAVMDTVAPQARRVTRLRTRVPGTLERGPLDQQALRQLRKAIRKDNRALKPSLCSTVRRRATRLMTRHRRHHAAAPGINSAGSRARTCTRRGNEQVRVKLKLLDDLARLGWYEQQHTHLQERARQRLASFSQPAASDLRSKGLSARLGIGLPSICAQGPGAELSIGATTTRTHELFSVDTGEVGAGHSRTHTLNLAANATVAAPLSVGAGMSASTMRAEYLFADSAPNFALIQARRKVARARMPLHRGLTAGLLRKVGNAVQPARDRFANAQLRALRWDSTLPVLTGRRDARVSDMLDNGARPDLQHVHVTTWSMAANAHARAMAADGTIALAAERTKIHVDVPLDPATTPLTSVERRQVLSQYRQRLTALASPQPLAQRTEGNAPPSALARLATVLGQPLHTVTLEQRCDIGSSLLIEFQCAQRLAAQCVARPPSSQQAQALADQCGEWGCKDINALGARMCDALNWLLLSAPDPHHAVLSNNIQSALSVIHSHPKDAVRAPTPDSTALFRRLEQGINTVSIGLSAGVTSELAAAGMAVAVAHSTRQDFNPLRSGRSIELTVDARGSVSVVPLLRLLKEHVPEAAPPIATEIAAAINEALPAASVQLDTRVRLHFRLFKPDYQHEKHFPAEARGMRLQQIRLVGQCGASADLTGSIPVATGLTVGGGLTFRTQRTRALAPDHFPAGTISGLLLRYKSLSDQTGESTPPWQRLCALHGRSLRALHAAWVNETCPASQETRYWLRRHPDASAHDQMELQWSAAALHPFDPARMKTVFDHLLAAVRDVQCQSERISPAYLPALDKHGRPELTVPWEITRL